MGHLAQSLNIVAAEMPDRFVVLRPQGLQCRHIDQNPTLGGKMKLNCLHEFVFILQVLEYVEEQKQVEISFEFRSFLEQIIAAHRAGAAACLRSEESRV